MALPRRRWPASHPQDSSPPSPPRAAMSRTKGGPPPKGTDVPREVAAHITAAPSRCGHPSAPMDGPRLRFPRGPIFTIGWGNDDQRKASSSTPIVWSATQRGRSPLAVCFVASPKSLPKTSSRAISTEAGSRPQATGEKKKVARRPLWLTRPSPPPPAGIDNRARAGASHFFRLQIGALREDSVFFLKPGLEKPPLATTPS